MKPNEERYSQFGLTRDMLATPEIVRKYETQKAEEAAHEIAQLGKLLMTGEGSSRIFPAKNAIHAARKQGWDLQLHTEAGKQALEYNLRNWGVFGLSNSGRTAEVISLFKKLADEGHEHRYSLTSFENSLLESVAKRGYVLSCGPEGAVAATKSVVEQALFYRSLLEQAAGATRLQNHLDELADAMTEALTSPIDGEITARIAQAGTIYWAGRNDGVAEELTLKTNEITRKPSDFLEGTYAVHGIEEVMTASDVLLWVDPLEDSEEKFDQVLQQGVGMQIIAISHRQTRFPTIRIPDIEDLGSYVRMCAGWNVLVEVGLAQGIDLDKPERARKVGNEFAG